MLRKTWIALSAVVVLLVSRCDSLIESFAGEEKSLSQEEIIKVVEDDPGFNDATITAEADRDEKGNITEQKVNVHVGISRGDDGPQT